jgi:hypothetical protein
VRELLRDQQTDLADRPLALGARGWDNQLWRLGDDLAARGFPVAAGEIGEKRHDAAASTPWSSLRARF